jgi:hypothetical protein
MWITIHIDNKEILLNDFITKLNSSDCMIDLIEEIQRIKEKWGIINLNFINESRDNKEEDIVFNKL